MANAKQCDRCGKFYTDEVTNPHYTIGKQVRSLNFTTGFFNNSTRTLDICPECNASFINWMDELTREVDKVDEESEDGHYEYGVFEGMYNTLVSSLFSNENDARAFVAGYKDGARPRNADLYLRKRLVMAWEPVKEDD